MVTFKRRLHASAPAVGCALLWGLVECLALWRQGWRQAWHRTPRRPDAA